MTTPIETDAALSLVEPFLKSLIRRMCPRLQLADREDILQDVRITLWIRAIPAFDSSRGAKLSTYLHRCARNAILDGLAKRSRARDCESLPDDLSIADEAEDHQTHAIAAAVLRNPEQYLCAGRARVVRCMADYPDHTIGDIAIKLGLSRPAVYTLMYHIRKDLLARCA
jgi:RNA polymerase sigma factor (sigma-70 family)